MRHTYHLPIKTETSPLIEKEKKKPKITLKKIFSNYKKK